MTLPNLEAAHVDQRKVTHYLLAFEHPEGSDKATFFSRFGFSITEWKILADALINHAKQNAVIETSESEYGIKYVIHGSLWCPDGRSPDVCSVWIMDRDSESPRLVTAYPL